MQQTVLRIQNCYSWLYCERPEVLSVLHENMRFRERGYFHSRLYKQKLWDGYTEFFSKKTGRFLTGLLPEVKAALKHLGEEYRTLDERGDFDFAFGEIGEDFLGGGVTLYDYQVDLTNALIRNRRGVICAPTAAGKAQPLDSLVATPKGFVSMGDIKVGDLVLTPKGKSTRVLGVFPQGVKKVYRVQFSNGDGVECCGDHLWRVNATYDRWVGKVLSTDDIRKRVKCPNGANRYNIDTPKNISFKKRKVEIDPYMMGLLLGDGCFRIPLALNFSSTDEEITKHISKNLKNGYKLIKRSGCDYAISSGRRGKGVPKNPYVKAISNMGLSGLYSWQKFVPEQYMINNFKCRLAVLQGLMDTDGHITKDGRISFASSSKRLADDVAWIVRSLGGIPYLSKTTKNYTYKSVKKQGRPAFIVNFSLPEGLCPFRLERKRTRMKNKRYQLKNRTICGVEYVGKKKCQCILVEDKDHLYITDHFVVTHNTNIMVSILKALPKGCPTLVLANKKSLVEQNYEEIVKWGFQNVGRLYGKYKDPSVITCATVQSLHKMEPLLDKVKALVVDEIHENMSKEPKKYFNKMKSCSVRAAVSATPFKFGGKDSCQKWLVKGYFGPALKSKSAGGILTTKHLQERGTLSKSICTFYPIREPDLRYEVYMDAVTRGIAENWSFHETIRDLVARLEGRTLILVERIAQGDSLASLIPGSLWVQGKDDLDTRKMVIDKLKTSKERVVAIGTQQIFTAGINVMTHNVINAAGGQADHHIIQRVGRGLRTADDKEILNYYDFVFYNNEYLLEHSRKRIKILQKEGHEIVVKDRTDF
jgi:superfamily II DNA or RNA helicase/intein/homing endonuclease